MPALGFARASLGFLMMIAFLHTSMAATVHNVGDSAGWTIGVDYNQWVSSQTFHVGDSIVFEYDPSHHNVVRVSHHEYNSCTVNATTKPETFDSGHDVMTFKRPGHHYYICGYEGHCEAGQKVNFRVVGSSSVSPTSAPAPAPGPAPTTKKNSGVSLSAMSVVGVTAFGFAVFGLAY
ncbi:hypothetical protein ACHQM5_014842 [Ranunculus cassubicifolius]